MIPLLFLLLLAAFGRAELRNNGLDCDNNRCLILVNCPDGSARVYTSGEEDAVKYCGKNHTVYMLLEIDTRSARRFDFRVFYNESGTELNLPGIVFISGAGPLLVMNGVEKVLNRSYPRGGNETMGKLTSGYRFTIETEKKEENLFKLFAKSRFCSYKFPGKGEKRKYIDCSRIYESFMQKVRCEPLAVVDHCEDEECSKMELTPSRHNCSSRVWQQNVTDNTWLWVDGMECDAGEWIVRRKTVLWNPTSSNSTRLFCGDKQPRCENYETGFMVLTFLIAIYCVFTSIVIFALFVILYHKMDDMKGPSKIKAVRMKASRQASKATSSSGSGSSSGSSSSSENKKSKATKKEPKQKNQTAIRKRYEPAKKSKASKRSNRTGAPPGTNVKTDRD